MPACTGHNQSCIRAIGGETTYLSSSQIKKSYIQPLYRPLVNVFHITKKYTKQEIQRKIEILCSIQSRLECWKFTYGKGKNMEWYIYFYVFLGSIFVFMFLHLIFCIFHKPICEKNNTSATISLYFASRNNGNYHEYSFKKKGVFWIYALDKVMVLIWSACFILLPSILALAAAKNGIPVKSMLEPCLLIMSALLGSILGPVIIAYLCLMFRR